MDAGPLIHRITLKRSTMTRSAGAEVPGPYQVYATVWGKFEVLNGTERWRAQQIDVSNTVRVTLRYRTDVLPSDRVEYRGVDYEITGVIPDELRRESLVLECHG